MSETKNMDEKTLPTTEQPYQSDAFGEPSITERPLPSIDGQLRDEYAPEELTSPDARPASAPSEAAAAQTFEGGCHCGAVRFRVTVDRLEAIACNCSICTMKGTLHVIVPEDRFEVLSGVEAIAVYAFNTGVAKHMFCKTCGIHPFYRPRSHPDCWDVNVRCLDGGVADRFQVVPFDGRDWEANVEQIR